MTDAPELLPCPFCSDSDPYTDEESCSIFGRRTGHKYAVACSNCEVSSCGSETLREAIAAWNTRANLHQQALDAAREEGRRAGLEEALGVLEALEHGWRSSNFYEGWDSALASAEDRIFALIDKPADRVAEAATHFAVYSATGVHVGLWTEHKIAADVLGDYPGGSILHLRAIAQKEGE